MVTTQTDEIDQIVAVQRACSDRQLAKNLADVEDMLARFPHTMTEVFQTNRQAILDEMARRDEQRRQAAGHTTCRDCGKRVSDDDPMDRTHGLCWPCSARTPRSQRVVLVSQIEDMACDNSTVGWKRQYATS